MRHLPVLHSFKIHVGLPCIQAQRQVFQIKIRNNFTTYKLNDGSFDLEHPGIPYLETRKF